MRTQPWREVKKVTEAAHIFVLNILKDHRITGIGATHLNARIMRLAVDPNRNSVIVTCRSLIRRWGVVRIIAGGFGMHHHPIIIMIPAISGYIIFLAVNMINARAWEIY